MEKARNESHGGCNLHFMTPAIPFVTEDFSFDRRSIMIIEKDLYVYNITDQIFIGQGVGTLGNAATTVAFPITIICTPVAILFGFGGAASLNLEMGRGNRDDDSKTVGTTFVCLLFSGIAISAIVGLFMEPLLNCFGATKQNIGYATAYVFIIHIGSPFLLISTGAVT